MKAIEININGTVRYSTIKAIDNGLCMISDRATNYIKSQSSDGKIYYGDWEQVETPFAYENRQNTIFYFKLKQDKEFCEIFGFDEKATGFVTCKVINIMED